MGRFWSAVAVVAVFGYSNLVDGADAASTASGSGSAVLLRAPAPVSLPDIKAIRAWAEKTSWGGNEIDVFNSDGRQVVVVRRSFTSGVETCGLAVFIPARRVWEPALNLDVSGFWLTVTQEGDSVRIVNSSSKAEVVRFSIAQLQANKASQTDGAPPRR